jgi:putative peptidoglycan lipid II flippase
MDSTMVLTKRNGRLARVAGIYGMSRGIGLLRELAAAYYFGTGAAADRYGLAFSASALIALVVSEAGFARGFGSGVGATVRGRLIALGTGGYVLVGILVVAVGSSEQNPRDLAWLLLAFFPVVLAAPANGLATASLTTVGRIGFVNLVQTLLTIGALGGLLLPLVVGAEPNVLFLATGWSAGNVLATWVLTRAAPEVSGLKRATLAPVVFAAAFMASQTLVDRLVATSLGQGAVAALAYGERFMLLPAGFILAAFGPLLIHESLTALDGGTPVVTRRLRQLAGLAVPSSLLLFGLIPQVIDVLLDRGAFSAASERLTAAAMEGLFAGIPLTCLMLALVRIMQSRAHLRPLVIGAGVGATVNLVASIVLGAALGVGGNAAATGVAAAVTCAVQLWLLRHDEPTIASSVAIGAYLPCLGSALACATVAWFVHEQGLDRTGRLLVCTALALAAAVPYLAGVAMRGRTMAADS